MNRETTKYIFSDNPTVAMQIPFMNINNGETSLDLYRHYVENFGKVMPFNYVDITTKGCEGWINLFFGEHIITCIPNVELANEIKKVCNKLERKEYCSNNTFLFNI